MTGRRGLLKAAIRAHPAALRHDVEDVTNRRVSLSVMAVVTRCDDVPRRQRAKGPIEDS